MVSKDDTTVRQLQILLAAFAEARDWGQFHTPRNLALALVGEVGELSALLQWLSDEEVEVWLNDERGREKLAAEMADVFAYLLRLADVVNVDLAAALRSKTLLNEARYPQDRARGSSAKYTQYE
jgi:NTP pyrophosphatase (non-canonical NTP hydrolase)